MKQETTKKERNMKKVGLVIAATAGTVCTIGLGALCVILAKDNKNLKLDNSIAREAYEGVAEKLFEQTEAYKELAEKSIQQNETIELVRNVVGGPLINTLIKNEELKRSRVVNKIKDTMKNNIHELTEATKIYLQEKENEKVFIEETIANYVNVRDTLKRD